MAAAKSRIVVVGSINMDLVSKVEAFPLPGETIRGVSFESHFGGKGANQAVGVARLKHPVEMIGMVGDDRIGAELLHNLRREGVGTTHIGIARSSSGTATILVNSEAENCIVIVPGANDAVTPELIRSKRDVIASAGLVLSQLEIPIESVATLADICKEYGVQLILDPAPAVKLPPEIFSKVSWFTPNESEAAFFAPELREVDAILTALCNLGPANVILKRGAAGSVLKLPDDPAELFVAPLVKAIDTTAAGDSFNAALAVGLLSLGSVQESMRFASAAAAICVTRPGAQSSLAYLHEVENSLGGGAARK